MDKDILYKLYVCFFSAVIIVEFYSIIGWIVTMITDRSNIKKRKKYAYIMLGCILILMCIGILSVARALIRAGA